MLFKLSMKPILMFSSLNFPILPKHRSDHSPSVPGTLQGLLAVRIIESKLLAVMARAWRVISGERS